MLMTYFINLRNQRNENQKSQDKSPIWHGIIIIIDKS